MSFPTVNSTWHVWVQDADMPVVCHDKVVAAQYLSSLPAGSYCYVEKVTEVHAIEQVYGTSTSPLPAPPAAPVSILSFTIEHLKRST